MTKLKTLNDFGATAFEKRWVDVDTLKQEAIKWAKEFREATLKSKHGPTAFGPWEPEYRDPVEPGSTWSRYSRGARAPRALPKSFGSIRASFQKVDRDRCLLPVQARHIGSSAARARSEEVPALPVSLRTIPTTSK